MGVVYSSHRLSRDPRCLIGDANKAEFIWLRHAVGREEAWPLCAVDTFKQKRFTPGKRAYLLCVPVVPPDSRSAPYGF